jgi:hypothetical protein
MLFTFTNGNFLRHWNENVRPKSANIEDFKGDGPGSVWVGKGTDLNRLKLTLCLCYCGNRVSDRTTYVGFS